MTKFKICGLREAKHAIAAAGAGADYMGFVFVEGVRRQLTEEQGRVTIQGYRANAGTNTPKLVGLFANQPLEFVNRVVESCGLDAAQLCGNESLEFIDRVAVPVIRQVRVRDEGPRQEVIAHVLEQVNALVSRGHMVQLDSHEAGALGGTGRTFDWGIAKEISKHYEIMLAGGLSPDNVGDAIRQVHPWAVDVSSGVESGGVKDVAKILKFAETVRRADKARA